MINIIYMAHKRKQFSPIIVNYIKKIKDENKKNIHVDILCSYDLDYWNNIKNELINSNIGCDCLLFKNHGNYLSKVKWAANREYVYSIKMDEDCFINNYVWDYIIENVDILNNDENLAISPLLSIGIPTTDRFVECFFTKDEQNKLYDIYSNFPLKIISNVDYTKLNDSYLNNWNSERFYQSVAKFQHHYKGIHPVRLSIDAQMYMVDLLLKKQELFKYKNDYSLITIDAPYLCNSFFVIKTKTWNTIINDRTLYVDNYDEVPFNLYRERNKLKILYIDKSFGIHTSYNWINTTKVDEKFINYSLERGLV